MRKEATPSGQGGGQRKTSRDRRSLRQETEKYDWSDLKTNLRWIEQDSLFYIFSSRMGHTTKKKKVSSQRKK